ncbi:MAG: DUF4365 domain-containing protein [Planctomycetota bacterium]
MKRSKSHQIDEHAQQLLKQALPVTWVLNEQHKDYGKDYLVEIGDENGELTGQSFYLQLKGQETVRTGAKEDRPTFPLKANHAEYYANKVNDLPVFLAVIDISAKRGWWLFLQPSLYLNQTWRAQKTVTLPIPIANDLFDHQRLRDAVMMAKRWMRLSHPISIHEAVISHKQLIELQDPRFEVKVSLRKDRPHFTLHAKQPVNLTIQITKDSEDVKKKFEELIARGREVDFHPGEITILGSSLFESANDSGCVLQASIKREASLSLICFDNNDMEIGRLNEIPGQFVGGQKELNFNGAYPNSPLTFSLGPVGPNLAGKVGMHFDPQKWNSYKLHLLPYFDRIYHFFEALSKSAAATVDCYIDGNCYFSVRLQLLEDDSFVQPLSQFLDKVMKFRKIARHFNIDPVWDDAKFDDETIDKVEQLYGVFIEGSYQVPVADGRLTATCVRKSFNFVQLQNAPKPTAIRISKLCTYKILDQQIDAGRLVFDYSDMILSVANDDTSGPKRNKNKQGATKIDRRPVILVADAAPMNIMSIRMASEDELSENGVTVSHEV